MALILIVVLGSNGHHSSQKLFIQQTHLILIPLIRKNYTTHQLIQIKAMMILWIRANRFMVSLNLHFDDFSTTIPNRVMEMVKDAMFKIRTEENSIYKLKIWIYPETVCIMLLKICSWFLF